MTNDPIETVKDELVNIGEYDSIEQTEDGLIVELFATTEDDLAVGSESLYLTADEHDLHVDEESINNPHPVGTDAHGRQTVTGLRFTISNPTSH